MQLWAEARQFYQTIQIQYINPYFLDSLTRRFIQH